MKIDSASTLLLATYPNRYPLVIMNIIGKIASKIPKIIPKNAEVMLLAIMNLISSSVERFWVFSKRSLISSLIFSSKKIGNRNPIMDTIKNRKNEIQKYVFIFFRSFIALMN